MRFSRQECVAIPFSRRSSQPRDRTWVSRTAHRFFSVWATREVPLSSHILSSCLTHTHYNLFTDEETVTVQGQKRIRPGYLFWAKQSVQSHLVVSDSVTPWTIQYPDHGTLQARILEWVAVPISLLLPSILWITFMTLFVRMWVLAFNIHDFLACHTISRPVFLSPASLHASIICHFQLLLAVLILAHLFNDMV